MKSPEVRISLILAILLSLCLSVMLGLSPIQYEQLAGKDLLLEDLTLWIFLAAGFVQVYILRKYAQVFAKRHDKLFMVFWLLLFFIAALEEVNWGQDFFHFPSRILAMRKDGRCWRSLTPAG